MRKFLSKKLIVALVLICTLITVLLVNFSPKVNAFDEMYYAAETRYTKNPIKRLINSACTFDGVGSTGGGRDYYLLVREYGYASFYISTEEVKEACINVYFDNSVREKNERNTLSNEKMMEIFFGFEEVVGKHGHYRGIEYIYYPENKTLYNVTEYGDFPEYTKEELQKEGERLLYDVVIKKWAEKNKYNMFTQDFLGYIKFKEGTP